MGQKFRDEAGHIWEMGPDGQPRLVQPAQSASPFADPRLGPQTIKAQNDAAASQYAPSTAASESQIKAADAANATALAQAQRDKAVADARAAEANAKIAGVGPKLDASTRAAALQGYSYAQQLQTTIDDLNTLYTAGPGATKGVEGVKDYLPYTENQAFDTKANAARGIVGQALGFTGGQLNTEREAEKSVGPYLPQAGDRDAVIQQKIKTLQDLANEAKAKSIQTLGGEPDANGNIKPVVPDASPLHEPQTSPAPTPSLATGATRDVVDPVLKATSGRIGRMLASGVPDAQITQFLEQSGVKPADTNIGATLQFRQTPDFKKWQRAHPGASYPIGPEFYTKKVPMTAARQGFNALANTNLGSDLAAGAVASANAISGGRLDNMAGKANGDPEMARTGMEVMRANHPVSSFVGDVAGQASLEAAAGLVPGAQGLMATRLGRRGLDLGYGGYSGSGENDSDPLMGAITGGASNLGFGMFGRGLQRGIGRTATGVKNASLDLLNKAGVPLTIGRIGQGSDNVVGHAIGGIEDRLAGAPIADAIINTARKRGDEGFNRAAFREVGGSGATGSQGLSEADAIRDKAYSFLDNTNIPLDTRFAVDQQKVRNNLPGLPAFGTEIDKGLDLIDQSGQFGQMAGRDWQNGIRSVRANRSSIVGQPFANEAVDTLKGVEGNLMGLAQRQVPGAASDLAKANALHGKVETLAAALDNGPTQMRDELFSPLRLDNVSRAGARNFGGRKASLTGKRPFYELSKAGLDAMPNLTPDSGTAGRSLLYSGLLGGIGAGGGAGLGYAKSDEGNGANGGLEGAGYGLALAGALASPYSKTGQKVIQKSLLAERPAWLEDLGRFLIKHPKAAGMFASGTGRDYFFQPELQQ